MLTSTANGDSRLSLWLRVREFAVPPSMIDTATARRHAGDWAGACAAAGVDVDLNLRTLARTHGRELAARLRSDLRRLAPDLLRWHMPRIAPDGLLRPGLTLPLARYDGCDAADRDGAGPVHLVVRTPPAWADAGQRISLGVWDGSSVEAGARRHPHPRPGRRFRLDLHRHLWDARRADELRIRSGADRQSTACPLFPDLDPELPGAIPQGLGCAVDRWAAEAALLLHAEGRTDRTVVVRLGGRRRLLLDLRPDPEADPDPGGGMGRGAGVGACGEGDRAGAALGFQVGFGPPALRIVAVRAQEGGDPALPVLPDAATWTLPDLELIRTGAIDVDRLHPLVASALAPERSPADPSRGPDRADRGDRVGRPYLVQCRGAEHRIGLVDGVLAPLDHDPAEIRREELLAALTGTPLPCLQAVDAAHRRPDCLTGVRERLDHGDTAGALAVVESLLGPDALLRDGALRDELETAALRRIAYGLYRSGLIGPGPDRIPPRPHPRDRRLRPHSRRMTWR
ncbi:hypothetical protein OG562_00330 [Streptomyces sp. NBC_01275]|uniref:hypothetical protein n=1 Tax=Streptomyces sp. NBC_01275 TaxID=2903807 RepID=UPI0022513079|nr:hypothetical protein [Streptomyces sp. NBC_01275]MCX4759462.1 hypothetical protein [Streptomyces sp. NBC_01275]